MGDCRPTVPFLDSQQHLKWNDKGFVVSARRPWTNYWPPRPGSVLHSWLEAECPEVLDWRFDPENPFDRPWQKWTQAARRAGRACPSIVLPALSVDGNSNLHKGEEAQPNEELGIEREPRRIRQEEGALEIDKHIKSLGLICVTATHFNYLAQKDLYDHEKPFHSRLPFLNNLKRSNVVSQEYRNIRIYNIAGFEKHFVLSISGFEFLQIPVNMGTWTTESVCNVYLPAMEAWLNGFFGSQKVHIYAYNFRCQDHDRTPSEAWIDPFMRAHCDVTTSSSVSRLKLHLPAEAAEIEKVRYRFIGVWRPLTGPEQDCPLAMCDYRSVSEDDLVRADIVFPHYCDEGYEMKYNPHHRWFYKQRMSSSEAIVFKLFDSCTTEARFCPHSAFVDDTVPPDTPVRASVELRAIIVG